MSPRDKHPAPTNLPDRIRAAVHDTLGIGPGDVAVRRLLSGQIEVHADRGSASAITLLDRRDLNADERHAIAAAVAHLAEQLGIQLGRTEPAPPPAQPLAAAADGVQAAVLRDIVRERARQAQLHPNDNASNADHGVFLAVILEELGEYAKATLEEGIDSADAYRELVQVAACATARAEAWRRRNLPTHAQELTP